MEIKPEDLVIDRWQSARVASWSTKVLRGVRILHRPTGDMVCCDTDRSPYKNRQIAMEMLTKKLQQRSEAEATKAYEDMVITSTGVLLNGKRVDPETMYLSQAKAAPAQAEDERDALADLRKAVQDGVSDEWLLGFVRQYPFAAAPAMGEELPQDERAAFDSWAGKNGCGDKYRESMFMAWEARACIALRQPGADLLAKMVAAPVAVSSKAEDGSVPVPTNANMAKMMVLLGSNWLVANAPDQLATAPVSQSSAKATEEVAPYPYGALFRSIGDAAKIEGTAISISPRQFVETLNSYGFCVNPVSQPAAQEPIYSYCMKLADGTYDNWRDCSREHFEHVQKWSGDGFKVRTLYAASQPLSTPAGSEQEKNAARWGAFEKALRSGAIPGAAHGRRFKVIETCPMYGTKSEFKDFIDAIDAALAAQQKEQTK